MKVTRKYGYAEYYARCTCQYLTDSCGNCRFRRDNPPPPNANLVCSLCVSLWSVSVPIFPGD